MFQINNFMSEISSSGVLRTNRYLVTFAAPKYLRTSIAASSLDSSGPSSIGLDRMTLRCESAQIPGMSFASIDSTPRIGYGPIESMPFGVSFDELTLAFLVDKKSEVHKFFYEWVNSIVNFHSQGQSKLKDALGPVKGMKTYEVGYKDDFVTDLSITMYDSVDLPANTPPLSNGLADMNTNKIMTVKAYRAFPKLLPSIDLAWGANDDVVRMVIPFTYTDFDIEYHQQTPTNQRLYTK